ncbi:MAG: prenyltransferase [Bdellovibrionales bacterium]|nr:prenyltransferase [Bdellovibrionales bacterium]
MSEKGHVSQSKYVSAMKGSAEYNKYILGKFSSQALVKPISQITYGNGMEKVIFKIDHQDSVSVRQKIIGLIRAFRPELLGLTFFAPIATLLVLQRKGVFLPLIDVVVLFLSLLCAHGAIYFLNDYFDHLNGVDRLDKKSGSQVIQKGIWPAYKLKIIGIVLFFLASLGGYSVLKFHPPLLLFVVIFGVVSIFGYANSKMGLKNLGLGELAVLLAMGPLISVGVSYCFTQDVFIEVFELGICFGYLSALVLQFRKLENIMIDSKAGIKTLMERLGFDLSKKLVALELLLVPVVIFFSMYYQGVDMVYVSLISSLSFAYSLYVIKKLRRSNSPLSTYVFNMGSNGIIYHSVVSVLLVLSLLSQSFS